MFRHAAAPLLVLVVGCGHTAAPPPLEPTAATRATWSRQLLERGYALDVCAAWRLVSVDEHRRRVAAETVARRDAEALTLKRPLRLPLLVTVCP